VTMSLNCSPLKEPLQKSPGKWDQALDAMATVLPYPTWTWRPVYLLVFVLS
jgi:hypothetical protein